MRHGSYDKLDDDGLAPPVTIVLDINPRAVKVAWINLFLNALDDNGLPIYDEEGKTLLDREEFHESDLLSYCRDNKIELERIIGCIPQGFVENQFGLSLIARAAEEGIAVIKPMGIMIFNMGGRPGQGVCKLLFERRDFRVTKLWQTKVMQAADTDVISLVEVEKNSLNRFEFFMLWGLLVINLSVLALPGNMLSLVVVFPSSICLQLSNPPAESGKDNI